MNRHRTLRPVKHRVAGFHDFRVDIFFQELRALHATQFSRARTA